jgi:hypothetical protein
LENNYIVRRSVITGSPYPVPYLLSVLEAMKHKRNLRKMDYSLASRVIQAIQLIKMGSDEFPLTEDNEDQLEALKTQMRWRETSQDKDMERIFQLFGNHTLTIEWIMPETTALLDESKYKSINAEIAIGLGFPRILLTGETERSFTSDPEIATVSPLQTMEVIRQILRPLLRDIVRLTADSNTLVPKELTVDFLPINMMSVTAFVQGVQALYTTGNLSREDYAAAFGFNWYEQVDKKENENEVIGEKGLEEFAPVPFGQTPDNAKETAKVEMQNQIRKDAQKKLIPAPKPTAKPAAKKPAPKK